MVGTAGNRDGRVPCCLDAQYNITRARQNVLDSLRRNDSLTAEREKYLAGLSCRGNTVRLRFCTTAGDAVMNLRCRAALWTVVWIALPQIAQAAISAAEVRQATGITSGLCVVVPASDVDLLTDLAAEGRMLVHGLCPKANDVATIRRAAAVRGLAGLVTAEFLPSSLALPFPTRSVNLLIADLDALGDRVLAEADLRRIVAPGGSLVVVQQGQRRAAKAPWPASMDDWTHFSYGPEANAVSRDMLAGVPTSLRWVAGVCGQDLRIARGTLTSPLVKKISWHAKETGEMRGRDAFNGLLRWTCPTGLSQSDRPNEWAISGTLVFHFPHHQPCHAVATDLVTGQVVRTFDEGVMRPRPEQAGKEKAVAVQVVCGETLIQSYGRRVAALSIATGKRLWQYESASDVGFLAATADGGRVFLHETSEPTRGRGRWGKHTTVRVTCLKEGGVAWQNEELKDQEVSDLVYHDGAVYVFDPVTNLGDDGDANVWKLSADNGRILWASEQLRGNYNISLNSILLRDGRVYSWGPFNNLRCYDAATGREQNLSINGYNQRCTRMSATRDWLIFGLSSWVARDATWTQLSVGRSDCSLPAYPAHGQVYFGSNVTCTCINPVRGIVAVGPEEPLERVADNARLENLNGTAARAVAAKPPPGLLPTEWQPDPLVFYYLATQTPPVRQGDLTIVADVHQHRLTAARGDEAVWAFTAGGRLYSPPLLYDNRAYVAAADGSVYCLDAATGRPHWRFLAAPARRNVVAYGQLESAWPVYNVVAHRGAICVAAGRHMELDGGLYVWGLDPQSGAVKWQTRLHTPPRVVPPGQKSPRDERAFMLEVAKRGALNGGLIVDDGRLRLRSPYFDKRGSAPSGTGYFTALSGPDKAFTYQTVDIDPQADNGKTLNPQDLVDVPKKK